jgi:Leucine-rich repeat (LRR) protein
MDNLQYLYVENNTSINNASVNNSLLAKLAANELANDWDSGEFITEGERTEAGTADYDYLIANDWVVRGAYIPLPPTFITSKAVGETINIYVETSTGYWKYNHNGTDFGPFNQNTGYQLAEVLNVNGEFTIISWDNDNEEIGGDVTYLDLYSNQLTEFDGTGLTSLTYLYLGSNQLTEFDGTPLTSLTELDLNDNQLTEFDGTVLTSLTYLNLGTNQLTSFDGTGLTSLTGLDLSDNQLTEFDGTPLTSLTELYLGSNQLTSFDGTPLTSLTVLYLNDNQLTTLGISNMDYLQTLYVNDNLLTASVNNSLLTKLAANELSNGWTYGEFYTTGGRTSAGTTDYDYLIANGWAIEGADLVTAVRKLRVKGVGQINQ